MNGGSKLTLVPDAGTRMSLLDQLLSGMSILISPDLILALIFGSYD